MVNTKLLGIYLNDHRAGAVVGYELGKRALASNRGNKYGEALAEIVGQIAADRSALEALMASLGIAQNRPKQAFAWTLEKLGRLKLNGQLRGYSPLSRLAELEGLALGVEGKLALWRSLERVAEHDARLAAADLQTLIARAQSQREQLERLRLQAADEALAETVD
jgi:hypothetical protein